MRFFIGTFFFRLCVCIVKYGDWKWTESRIFYSKHYCLGRRIFLVLIFWFNSSKQPFSIKSLTSILLCSFSSSEKKNRFFEKIHSFFLPCNFAWKREKKVSQLNCPILTPRTEKGSLQYADNSTPISGATLGICKPQRIKRSDV